MVGEPVEERGGHLGVAKDARPFSECEIGCDDNGCAFVKLADQVEQQLTAGLREGQISEFIQDQEVEPGDQVGSAALSFCAGFSIELVHQIDHIEEPATPSFSDAGAGNADREVGFTRSGSTNQNQIALVIQEVARGKVTDQGLVDLGGLKVELVDLFGQWQLGDGHLVFDRSSLLLGDLSME